MLLGAAGTDCGAPVALEEFGLSPAEFRALAT